MNRNTTVTTAAATTFNKEHQQKTVVEDSSPGKDTVISSFTSHDEAGPGFIRNLNNSSNNKQVELLLPKSVNPNNNELKDSMMMTMNKNDDDIICKNNVHNTTIDFNEEKQDPLCNASHEEVGLSELVKSTTELSNVLDTDSSEETKCKDHIPDKCTME